ncbi:MAG: glycosyltransferase family 2 protein [Planctomycetia bacterium]|nr:glycosyltransferase family 2 protein [Planctomycetia bacterium]
MNIAAIIPAYAEARHIAPVVRGVLRHLEVALVVDDGSPDDTAEVAEAAGATVIAHATNRGKGVALASGFDWLEQHSFDGAICLDADGQHDPEEIPKFLRVLEAQRPDVIVGNRMTDLRQMPRIRRFSNRLASVTVSALAGQRISDPQSGYRYVSLDAWREASCETAGFEAEWEFLLRAGRLGFSIVEFPIATIYGSEQSKFRYFRDTLRCARVLLRYALMPGVAR